MRRTTAPRHRRHAQWNCHELPERISFLPEIEMRYKGQSSELAVSCETSVYDRYKLEPGHHINGPAVVEETDSNPLINPDFQADVDTFGNLLIRRSAASTWITRASDGVRRND